MCKTQLLYSRYFLQSCDNLRPTYTRALYPLDSVTVLVSEMLWNCVTFLRALTFRTSDYHVHLPLKQMTIDLLLYFIFWTSVAQS
jgi:hypothetical protein